MWVGCSLQQKCISAVEVVAQRKHLPYSNRYVKGQELWNCLKSFGFCIKPNWYLMFRNWKFSIMSILRIIESCFGKIESSSLAFVQFCTSTEIRGKEISGWIEFKEKAIHPAYEIIVGDKSNIFPPFLIAVYHAIRTAEGLQVCLLCPCHSQADTIFMPS